MKILVVDDHALFRAGLRLLLGRLAEGGEGADILEAENVDAGLRICTAAPGVDLVLLDLLLEGTHGFDGLAEIRQHCPHTPVAILSGAGGAEVAAEARRKGASGFISKAGSPDEMLDAVRCMLAGGEWFPDIPPIGPAARLTPRQIDVLRGLCRGLANKEIGRELGMSENTVRSHVAAIFRVLRVSSRTEAALTARRYGLA